MTSAPAIGFDYRPSRLPRYLLGIVASLALVAIGVSSLAWWWMTVLAVGTTVAVVHAFYRLSHSPVAGVALAGLAWTLYGTDRTESPATLRSFRVLGGFVLLRLAVEGRVEALVLANDNSDPDLRRRLRMRLSVLRHAQPVADL